MNKSPVDPTPTDWNGTIMQKRIARRYAAERRFKAMGFGAVALSTIFLAFLLFTMLGQGVRGFQRTEVAVDLDFPTLTSGASAASITGPNAESALNSMDIPGLVELAVSQQYGADGGALLTSAAAANVRQMLLSDPELIGAKQRLWLPAASDIDIAYKGTSDAAIEKTVSDLSSKDAVQTGFNWTFLTGADATDPSAVGIWAAFKGSLMTMAITLLLAFPARLIVSSRLSSKISASRSACSKAWLTTFSTAQLGCECSLPIAKRCGPPTARWTSSNVSISRSVMMAQPPPWPFSERT